MSVDPRASRPGECVRTPGQPFRAKAVVGCLHPGGLLSGSVVQPADPWRSGNGSQSGSVTCWRGRSRMIQGGRSESLRRFLNDIKLVSFAGRSCSSDT